MSNSGWDDDVGPVDRGNNYNNNNNGSMQMSQEPGFPQQHQQSGGEGYSVRIRGIPFQESEHTVHKWLQDRGVNVRNGVLGIHFVYSEKRQWSGDAYAALQSEKDMETALKHDQDQMNHRYLEIFACSVLEMEDVLKRTGYYRLPNDYTIRLRGLEFKVTREDIMEFFKGLDIASGLDGIFIIRNHDGRTTGEAYVLFENKAGVEQAVQKHKEKMGERYVEIFLASSAHLRDALAGDGDGSRGRDQGGYGRGGQSHSQHRGAQDQHFIGVGRGGHHGYQPPQYVQPLLPRGPAYRPGFYPPNDAAPQYGVDNRGMGRPDRRFRPSEPPGPGFDHGPPAQTFRDAPGFRLYMRGLPWTCGQQEIEKFFEEVKPTKIRKNMSETGVFDGSAWVEFGNEADWTAAKRFHKGNMGHRYIELFTEQEVDEKRLGTATGRLSGPIRSDRGGRSSRGGHEGSRPRGGGGSRHQTRGNAGGSIRPAGAADYGRGHSGHTGPKTPYDRPLHYQPQPPAPNSYGGYSPAQQQGGYASYTSFQHQPVQPPIPPLHYANNNGSNGNSGQPMNYGYTQYNQYPSSVNEPQQPPPLNVGYMPSQQPIYSAPHQQGPYGMPPGPQGMNLGNQGHPPNIQYASYPAP